MSDTGKIGELVAWRMMDIVWNGSYLIFILINMLLINVDLALYILALVPIAVLVITLFQKKLVVFNRKIREINSKITGNFNEGITGAKSIKTLVVEDSINEDFRKDTKEMERCFCPFDKIQCCFLSFVTMMGSAALAIVLWQGGIITCRVS
jgi:ATP-binding cassette subfamily B protein